MSWSVADLSTASCTYRAPLYLKAFLGLQRMRHGNSRKVLVRWFGPEWVLFGANTTYRPSPLALSPPLPQTEGTNEVAGSGPSGDFEIREEERRNDLGRGRGVDVGAEPDLIGNTVDTGSSAAQLPQKNILERKEVLIGSSIRTSQQTLGPSV